MIDVWWLAFWLFLPGLFIFGVSAAIAGLRSDPHPKWLEVIGILVAITAFLGAHEAPPNDRRSARFLTDESIGEF
jgi:hypothetical protein